MANQESVRKCVCVFFFLTKRNKRNNKSFQQLSLLFYFSFVIFHIKIGCHLELFYLYSVTRNNNRTSHNQLIKKGKHQRMQSYLLEEMRWLWLKCLSLIRVDLRLNNCNNAYTSGWKLSIIYCVIRSVCFIS